MNPLKRLAGQTAIYGLSSIIGRFLNYLLTPLFTSKHVFNPDQYGIITEMYAYVAFLIILLTYGMETAFFRYSTLEGANKKRVYSTTIFSIASTTFFFIAIALAFSQQIADWLKYPEHNEYVIWFAIIVGLDAFATVPMAKLRSENKAIKFAVVNLINVAVNIALNLFFLVYCRLEYNADGPNNFLIDTFYNPSIGVGYVFIANLAASGIKFILLIPEIFKVELKFQFSLLKNMLIYAYPMLFVGIAGIVNETFDKILLNKMLWGIEGEVGTRTIVGIYGANYKLSVLILLFITAFRYAADPFFFSQEKEKNAKETYSKVMTYFVAVVCVIFLMVTLYLSLFKYFIPNPVYWEGLKVVPILLWGYICLELYYNLSVWYKLSHKTKYGAIISIIGAAITILINVLFIPEYGYMASAWATFICYAVMVLMSYFIGRKHYRVDYHLPKIFLYMGLALLLFFISADIDYQKPATTTQIAYNSLLFVGYIAFIYFSIRPKKVVI